MVERRELKSSEAKSRAESLQLIGGALAVDFVNTVGDRKAELVSEHLSDYRDLVAWSRHAGILGPCAAQQLLLDAASREKEAARVYRRALALREALYRIFFASAAGLKPQLTDLGLLNEILAEAMSHARLANVEPGYAWDWSDDADGLGQMLYPIARSAADMLTSGHLARLRECQDDECGWLFIDTSKNHSRRWCSMEDCGNRAKARRHYRRARSSG